MCVITICLANTLNFGKILEGEIERLAEMVASIEH